MRQSDYEYDLFNRYWDLVKEGVEVNKALEQVSEEWQLSLEQVKYDINETYEEYLMSDWLDVEEDPLGFD